MWWLESRSILNVMNRPTGPVLPSFTAHYSTHIRTGNPVCYFPGGLGQGEFWDFVLFIHVICFLKFIKLMRIFSIFVLFLYCFVFLFLEGGEITYKSSWRGFLLDFLVILYSLVGLAGDRELNTLNCPCSWSSVSIFEIVLNLPGRESFLEIFSRNSDFQFQVKIWKLDNRDHEDFKLW